MSVNHHRAVPKLIDHLPTVELPVLGVGLGNVADYDHIVIHINNRMPFAQPAAIAAIPVRRRAAGCGFERDGEPLLYPPEARVRAVLDLPVHHYTTEIIASLEVPRVHWTGADGLLFVLVFTAIGVELTPASVARALEPILINNVSRCVVPSRAVDNLVSLTAPEAPPAPQFCFALSSCQFTPGLFDATPALEPSGSRSVEAQPTAATSDHSYARLAAELGAGQVTPQLLILAGDQVYTDGDAGLFDPAALDDPYVRPYEQLYSSVYVQEITRQLPWCPVIDDHEIIDNWENEPEFQARLQRGKHSYLAFQRLRSLIPYDPTNPDRLWATLRAGGYDFFFADTRTERQTRTALNINSRALIAAAQRRALLNFLATDYGDARPRFVISPSILIPRRLSTPPNFGPGALQSDAWDGYPETFHWLFDTIAKQGARHVFFLSGDEHRCAVSEATRISEDAEPITVHSIHASGMYAPFRFVNAIPEDFRGHEQMDAGGSRWRVSSRFASAGQGFAIIHIERAPNTWTLRVRYSLNSGDVCHAWSWTGR